MEIDIYCKDGKCPICDSEMKVEYCDTFYDNDYYCRNKCYQIEIFSHDKQQHDVVLFDVEYIEIENFDDKEKVKKRIQYWKENDRYLMKLLER